MLSIPSVRARSGVLVFLFPVRPLLRSMEEHRRALHGDHRTMDWLASWMAFCNPLFLFALYLA